MDILRMPDPIFAVMIFVILTTLPAIQYCKINFIRATANTVKLQGIELRNL